MSSHVISQNFLNECDLRLRQGRGQEVASILNQLDLASIERPWRLPLAKLARRAGVATVGLKLLAVLVRGQTSRIRRLQLAATHAERAEYAALLNQFGATSEALLILNSVDVQAVPEAGLFASFCHFRAWDYAAAIPLLQTYLRSPLESYAHTVGEVNLAAALTATGEIVAAKELLERLITTAQAQGLARLEANCLEMRAQVALREGEFDRARSSLAHALSVLGLESSRDALFVRKWLAVADWMEHRRAAGLLAFREDALAAGDSESVREADLYLVEADVVGDGDGEARLARLYFGTPFPAYRQRVQRQCGRAPTGEFYDFGSVGGGRLDLISGEIEGGAALNPGKQGQLILAALLRDLYRPLTLGGLFSLVFAGDHFDIFSSPDRLHQAVARARREFSMAQLPIEIAELGGFYKVEFRAPFVVRLPREVSLPSWPEAICARARASFHGQAEFTAAEARTRLELSAASFTRFTAWALAKGVIERQGAGPSVRYTFRRSA